MNLITTKRPPVGPDLGKVFAMTVVLMLGGMVAIMVAVEIGIRMAGIQ